MGADVRRSLQAKYVPLKATSLLEVAHGCCNFTDGLLLNQEKLAALHMTSHPCCDVTLNGTEIYALHLKKTLNEP
jgi:hypothetical protein